MPNVKPLHLVAGGAGFIGSHLCDALLQRGDQVLCVDNLQSAWPGNLEHLRRQPNFEFVAGDISAPLPAIITRRTAGLTHIWNLACAASPPRYQADPEHTMLTNVVGTDQLLRLAEAAGARFLLTSTSEVYGDPEQHPQVEGYRGSVNCTGPRACYDEGKRAAEALSFDFARLGRADVRVARIFNTYGPHMQADDGRIVSNVINQMLGGEAVTVYGDGSQTRSLCYVADMVNGLIRLMDVDTVRDVPVNLGNPDERSILEIVATVALILGVEPNIRFTPLPQDDPLRRRPDVERAKTLLGWDPVTPIEAGLARTVEWFREVRGQTGLMALSIAAE